jgi:hypothetical protein
MSKTKKIDVLGKEFEYFRSANSVKEFARVISGINAEEVDDKQSIDLMEYAADAISRGMRDAISMRGLWYRITHRPPSKKTLMRCMTIEELMGHINGTNGEETKDPNL